MATLSTYVAPKKRREVSRGEFDLFPSEFTTKMIMMPTGGDLSPFSFGGRHYLIPIYDTPAQNVLLLCGRQTTKSQLYSGLTSLSNGRLVELSSINVGDRLCCLETNEGSGKPSTCTKTTTSRVSWKSGIYKKPCLRMKTRQGHEITVAKTHPMRRWDGWAVSSTFSVGDRLAVCRSAGIFVGKSIPEEVIKLTAYLIGDGRLTGTVSFYNTSSDLLDEFSNAVVKLGGAYRAYTSKISSCLELRVRRSVSPVVVEWLSKSGLLGTNSYTKKIPDWVFDLSREGTALFVNRLWSTGGVAKQRETGQRAISYTSMSKMLIRQLQALLWKFGIPTKVHMEVPKVYKGRGEYGKIAYTLKVETQKGVRKFAADIGAYGKVARQDLDKWPSNSQYDTFPSEVSELVRQVYKSVSRSRGKTTLRAFGIKRLPRKSYHMTVDKLRLFVDFFDAVGVSDKDGLELLRAQLSSDIFWDEIISIEDVGEQDCCDIAVENYQNFITNAFITHNSTTLGNTIITYTALRKYFRSLFVSPTQIQTETFSRDRVASPISMSDRLKTFVRGADEKSNVLYKKFNLTKSDITFRYAFLNADRVRGVPADLLLIDEIQDILIEVIPIIEECLSASAYKIRKYSGTPKSTDNTISFYWNKYSTQNEWAMPCTAGHWGTVGMDNIGKEGLICTKCGKPLLPLDPRARWVSMRSQQWLKDPPIPVPFEGYRIPQPLSPAIDWVSILDKMQRYGAAEFHNEVLGLPYDSGEKLLTKDAVQKCCSDKSMRDIDAFPRVDKYMGIDWSGGGMDSSSYTVVTIGGYLGNKFHIFYMKKYEGANADRVIMMNDIKGLIHKYNIRLVGVDYGGGMDTNDQLIRTFGLKRIVKYQYVNVRKLHFDAILQRFMTNRAEVLMAVINGINRGDTFSFPKWEEFETPFADDMCSIFGEWNKSNGILSVTKYPEASDDALHSMTYCFLASMLQHPRPDIITPVGGEE